MTDIDEEVRSLLTMVAETITPDSVPRLRLPEPAPGLPSARPHTIIGARRWLAPAAAGVAVLAIVLAAAVVAGRPHARSAGRDDATVPKGIPAYYIAMTATTGRPTHLTSIRRDLLHSDREASRTYHAASPARERAQRHRRFSGGR